MGVWCMCNLVDCSTNEDLLDGSEVGFQVMPCQSCGGLHIFFGNDGDQPAYRLDLDSTAVHLLIDEMVDKLIKLQRMTRRRGKAKTIPAQHH